MFIEVKTTDLKPGDIVCFANLRDEVVEVTIEPPPSVIVNVRAKRLTFGGVMVSWCAGNESTQTLWKKENP